jgi:glycosyltransferase involved in cell wall biosynthesis
MDISVILPTYNRSTLLEYTLKSLALQQTGGYRFEVVVADDGSSDDTCAIVEKYKPLLRIKYVYQEDLGYRPASARNKAIEVAEGELCLFVDSGIILNTDVLYKHILFHEKEGPYSAAVGYVYGFDREDHVVVVLKKMIDPDDPAASVSAVSQHEIYFDVREMHFRNHQDQIHTLPAPWLYFWTGHVSVSRRNLLKVGMFDESYDGRWGVEDNDLGMRLFQAGIKIHLLRSAKCIHYPHNDENKPDRVLQGRENCQYFHDKFQTYETALFLKHYGDLEFVDINLISLRQSSNA